MYSSRTKKLLALLKNRDGDKEKGYCNASTAISNLLGQSNCNLRQNAVIVEKLPYSVVQNEQVSGGSNLLNITCKQDSMTIQRGDLDVENENYSNHNESKPEQEKKERELSIIQAESSSSSSEEVSDDRDLDYSPDESDSDGEQSSENTTFPGEKKKSRKRVRRPQNWDQIKRKTKKSRGEEYKTKNGIVKKSKVLQPPCNCKRKCYNMIHEIQRNNLFSGFYNMNRHAQDQLIAETIEETYKERERLAPGKTSSRRQFSRKYYLKSSEGIRTEVCQKMYLKTFDISLKKVRVITEKKRDNNGVCPPDGRGLHNKHRKISEESKDIIRKQISSFPAYTSHYSREKTSKHYLSPDLTISGMYRLYLKQCENSSMPSLKEFQYRKIFNEEFNLSFHHPLNDTCAKCDRLNLSLKSLNTLVSLTEEQIEHKKRIEIEIKDHLEMAEKGYENKRENKAKSKLDPSCVTISFDLEKCLPTPYLRNGVSFYKRQLWVYNLTLYQTDNTGNKGICLLWNETLAGRGGQEIASCLRKYILDIPSNNIKTLNFYSDSCSGQNRNIYVATMFCRLLQELPETSSITEINHTFLEPGHTHMEADTIHSAIERAKKNTTMDIEVPHDWANFIKTSVYRKNKLSVIEMCQEEFLNFGDILKTLLVHRKKDEEGNMVPWMQIKQMKFQRNLDYQFFYKTNFQGEDFKKVDLRRGTLRNRQNITFDGPVQPINKEHLPIAIQKFNDLMELLPFISDHNKLYYQNLNRSAALDGNDYPALEEEC